MNNVVFMITSVIYFMDNPLSYSQVRSVFTPEERAEQTLQTIQSIRAKAPKAKIILIEMGLKEVLPFQLDSLVDQYLFLGKRSIVREAVDSPYKGLGEAVGLLLANRWIQSLEPEFYFKISGRYFLNDDFYLNDWLSDHFIAKNNGWISTILYGFSKRYYPIWRNALKKSIPSLQKGAAIENTMPAHITPILDKRILGVSGVVAPWNQSVSE